MTQNQNPLILGDNRVHSGNKSEPGVQTSTMLFESKRLRRL